MTDFTLAPRWEDGDRFYADLVRASEQTPESERLDFALRLILLLANQIGTQAVLHACVEEALRPCLKDQTP